MYPELTRCWAALVLCGLLTACGGGGSKSGQASTPVTPTTPTPPTTPTTPTTPTPPASTYGAEFTVHPSGDDNNPGTPDKPFKSLEKARDAARAIISKGVPAGGIAVWLRGGIYERTSTLELGPLDSGKNDSDRVEWRSFPGEVVRIVGGKKVNASLFTPVVSTSPSWSRLDDSAKGQVLQLNLSTILGITPQSTEAAKEQAYGTLKPRGYQRNLVAALELFIDTHPMTLARWPDADDGQSDDFASTTAPVTDTRFSYTGDRPARWSSTRDVWVDGFWGASYAEFHIPVSAIDHATKQIVLLNAPPSYGLAANKPWFIYNLLEEITTPGEWYLDRTDGMLYLWPPAGFNASADVIVSRLETSLVSFNKASFISFHELTIEASRKNLIDAREGRNLDLADLILRNAGTSAISSVYGTNNKIQRCSISGCGQEAVRVAGGDRASLTKGNNSIEDCEIHNFGRFQFSGVYGVQVEECGNVIRHNHIHDAPDRAIAYWGNEHLIEYNKINDVCRISNDVGGIYSGRDWGARGNIIRYNFLYNLRSALGNWVHAIYLDDSLSGIRVEGNIVYQCSGSGIILGGGRDNVFVNNLIAKSGYGLLADSRGRLFIGNIPQPGASSNLLEKLQKLNYQQVPWAGAYPSCAAIPSSWITITNEAHWVYPEGNVFARNVGWQNSQWMREQDAGTFGFFAELADNIENQDPFFTDEPNLNLLLRTSSPAFLIPGFEDIPFDEIGIRK